ncbi:MAG: dihydrodipicolinate synthase family protein [Sedimentisphaerales bacterium]|jgi:N-acetylneuraminate lyase|nr:dihydrodipicolinate synthase family protein [Sedimentisphaerales bacterium]HNY80064.1 dihydrodipicolinate synthase family protein [Sedimentisphaerales bacterium]HOC64947.1 dihydrodipicolinate synthase family protein [Sedimentisphaerales bacterium]HOH65885.1 dihydrodipicolinate synthase family protein [Sedimentisphaerales bacterium]HPY49855.1 dihydrodipicolinate synthase family protein [Sedimentisphaerales bacterium]
MLKKAGEVASEPADVVMAVGVWSMAYRLTGLIAATYTPLCEDGSLHLDLVPAMVDFLERSGVTGIYICGSTGEGMSLSGDERRAVAEAYVQVAKGRLKTIVQVGHNSLAEAAQLAGHARWIGADAISATAPSYFKVGSIEVLADCMAQVASGAPDLPFYYYNIPSLTGVALDMVSFLPVAAARIPNLVGMKYTAPTVFEFQACLELEGGRFDCVWGCDEMLLSALAAGARGAIGSTYNTAAPLYRRLMEAFERGDLAEARRLQSLSIQMVRAINRCPFHPAMKQILAMSGLDCGPCRLPLPRVDTAQVEQLRRDLNTLGFFDWSRPAG